MEGNVLPTCCELQTQDRKQKTTMQRTEGRELKLVNDKLSFLSYLVQGLAHDGRKLEYKFYLFFKLKGKLNNAIKLLLCRYYCENSRFLLLAVISSHLLIIDW